MKAILDIYNLQMCAIVILEAYFIIDNKREPILLSFDGTFISFKYASGTNLFHDNSLMQLNSNPMHVLLFKIYLYTILKVLRMFVLHIQET